MVEMGYKFDKFGIQFWMLCDIIVDDFKGVLKVFLEFGYK